jgi:signal transduction histidine kinase
MAGDEAQDAADALALEARIAVLSELALGAAHTLNNALTAIGGEASFLQSESKDPELDEACGVILEQVQRCARLTHALLRRRAAPEPGPPECELGRVLDFVERDLGDALSRRFTLRIERCEEPLYLALPAEELETIVLLLVQLATLRLPDAGELRLRSQAAHGGEAVRLELRSGPLAPATPLAQLHERLLRGMLSARGGSLAFEPSDGSQRACLTLPPLSQ